MLRRVAIVVLALVVILMAFSLFRFGQRKSPEQAFWSWFVDNERRLFEFEKDQDAVFAELGPRMKAVDENLTFEFGPVESGRREFVISADGAKAGFPAVEALHAAAPQLERWEWVKFRPRRESPMDLRFNGRYVRADDVHYVLAKDGDRIGIVLLFESEDELAPNDGFTFLFLDQVLGEFTVETQVGFIERKTRSSELYSQSRPLRELAAHFDEVTQRR